MIRDDDKVYKSFTDLEVWKSARNYKKSIQKLVTLFPSSEKYRLEDQLTRSSRSIGNNIAEGYGKYTYKDQIHYCMQARGSLFESLSQIIDAFDAEYIAVETLNDYKKECDTVEKLLNGYIAWLRKMSNEK